MADDKPKDILDEYNEAFINITPEQQKELCANLGKDGKLLSCVPWIPEYFMDKPTKLPTSTVIGKEDYIDHDNQTVHVSGQKAAKPTEVKLGDVIGIVPLDYKKLMSGGGTVGGMLVRTDADGKWVPVEGIVDLSDVRAKGEPINPVRETDSLEDWSEAAALSRCTDSIPHSYGKKQCRNQRLVDVYTSMAAVVRETWLNYPVVSVMRDDRWSPHDLSDQAGPLVVSFSNWNKAYYNSHEQVCEIVSALQECSDYKPSDKLQTYLNEHRKIEHITFSSVITKNGMTGGHITGDKDIDADDSSKFSNAPFKVIRDYLYACAFLSPFAPNFVDYANELLAYRLSYAISQEKEVNGGEAIRNLGKELNDFARHHVDNAYNLKASTQLEMFTNVALPILTIRSDFGIIRVQHEPELTAIDWEKRYMELRQRHAGQ